MRYRRLARVKLSPDKLQLQAEADELYRQFNILSFGCAEFLKRATRPEELTTISQQLDKAKDLLVRSEKLQESVYSRSKKTVTVTPNPPLKARRSA